MRFGSLGMTTTTHLRCTDGIVAALLSCPKFRSNRDLIAAANKFVLGHKSKWAYAYFLPKTEAKKTLVTCLTEIIRKHQSTGKWKRKNSEIHTYGILRALKHAELLDQIQFKHDPYRSFINKTDLISVLIRKNIMEETDVNTEDTTRLIFAEQSKNGSWYNSLSATSFRLQELIELGFNRKNPAVSQAVNWIYEFFHEALEWRRQAYAMRFQNAFFNNDNKAEEEGYNQTASEIGRTCIHHAAMSSAIVLYTLTRLGIENDKHILKAFQNLYNLRGIKNENGEIKDEIFWCACL